MKTSHLEEDKQFHAMNFYKADVLHQRKCDMKITKFENGFNL